MYVQIAKRMPQWGHNRDEWQCHVKVKEFCQAYHRLRELNKKSGADLQASHFYNCKP